MLTDLQIILIIALAFIIGGIWGFIGYHFLFRDKDFDV